MPARCGRPAPPRLVRLTLAASHLQFFWGVTPRLSRNESSPVPVANSREARFPPKESTSSDPRSEANDPHMDYVCIGARNLIFKFGRWRSENYEVRVSPSCRSEEHTSELQSRSDLVCRLLLEKKNVICSSSI